MKKAKAYNFSACLVVSLWTIRSIFIHDDILVTFIWVVLAGLNLFFGLIKLED